MPQKQLGQVRAITAGTPVSIYSPGTNVEATNLILTICNQTATARFFRVFQDDNGTDYTQPTAIHYGASGSPDDLAAFSTRRLPIPHMNNSSGNLAVDTETTDALTFTLHGTERTVA